MLLSSYSSLSSQTCNMLSADGFDVNAKIRTAWISPDNSRVMYTNEVDKTKSLQQFSLIDEVKKRAESVRWNKHEKVLHKNDDIAYTAEKCGFMWIMCFFNNVTIETNDKMHWMPFDKKMLLVDVIKSMCSNVEMVTYDIVVQRHSTLYGTWNEFENDLADSLQSPNKLHPVGKVYHHDRRTPGLRYYHRMQSYLRDWFHEYDDCLKYGYDWIEHATYDTYHPFMDLGRPEQEPMNYDENGDIIVMPLSVAINDKNSYCYMTTEELSKLTKEQMEMIRTSVVRGPYEPLKWAINNFNVMVDLTYWPPKFGYG